MRTTKYTFGSSTGLNDCPLSLDRGIITSVGLGVKPHPFVCQSVGVLRAKPLQLTDWVTDFLDCLCLYPISEDLWQYIL